VFRSAADALVTLEELKGQGVALHMIDLGGDVTGNGISKAMRKANKTLREIGTALNMPFKTVARILDREKAPDR
jgi:hypothetical protein